MEADKLLVTLLSVWIMVLPSPLSCSWIPSASNDLLTRDDDDKVCCHDENGLYKVSGVEFMNNDNIITCTLDLEHPSFLLLYYTFLEL
jgi:hypothetical protein